MKVFKTRVKRERPQKKLIDAQKLLGRLNLKAHINPNSPQRLINVCVTYPNGRLWVHEFKSSQGALKFIGEMVVLGHKIEVNAVWGE